MTPSPPKRQAEQCAVGRVLPLPSRKVPQTPGPQCSQGGSEETGRGMTSGPKLLVSSPSMLPQPTSVPRARSCDMGLPMNAAHVHTLAHKGAHTAWLL